jgi:hypothetical protein
MQDPKFNPQHCQKKKKKKAFLGFPVTGFLLFKVHLHFLAAVIAPNTVLTFQARKTGVFYQSFTSPA